jgi:hypothetical protein
MKHLYHTRNKKAFFGFTKRTAITTLVLLLGFISFSQTSFQSTVQEVSTIQDSTGFRLSFYATLKNETKVVLNWVISGGKPASHFIIQRSSDGNDFNDAAVLFTDNNTHPKKYYRYADNISNVDSGLLYYRIKTVGLDGKTDYSKVKAVRVEKKIEEQSITIKTINPASDLITIPNPQTR